MTTAENVPVIERMETVHDPVHSMLSDRDLQVAPYFRWKGLLDKVLAVLMLVPGLPLLGALMALVRLTSKGPAIFKQERVGKNGKLFTMYKLRSMRCDAEAVSGPMWTVGNDQRITWLGKWLRRLHLDELPQLFNVLSGDMSLIGPRPERLEFVLILEQKIPGYRDRLRVLPGITGLAQINLPPDSDLDSVKRKQILDLEYIRTASLLLDLRMLVSTFLRMVGVRGTVVMRLMRLKREVRLDGRQNHREPRYCLTPQQLAAGSVSAPGNNGNNMGYAGENGRDGHGSPRPEGRSRSPK
jgi:lipopolysaccharide/colanic/teichoic acid biosynthesis glycosyltransferase